MKKITQISQRYFAIEFVGQPTKLTSQQVDKVIKLGERISQLNILELRALFFKIDQLNFKRINVSMSPQPSFFLPIHPINLKYQLESPGSLVGQSGWPQNLVKAITEQSFLDKLIAAVEKVEKLGPVQAKKDDSKDKQEQQQKKEEKSEKNAFNVVLKSIKAENKIKVIKEVKTMTGWGLKECKDKIEALDKNPLILGQNVPKEKAQKWLDTLKELQSVVELQ